MQRRSDVLPAAHLKYHNTREVILAGKHNGVVNFSRLPTAIPEKDVHFSLLSPLGEGLGIVELPPPPGIPSAEAKPIHERNLRIHILKQPPAGRHAKASYLLATQAALEQISQAGEEMPTEGQGVVTLHEGDVFPVGRNHWLPAVGTAVDRIKENPAQQRLYSSTSGVQGTFSVAEGQLFWKDAGYNHAAVIHAALEPEHVAHQDFVATGRIAVNGANGSVMAPATVPGSFDQSTGHRA